MAGVGEAGVGADVLLGGAERVGVCALDLDGSQLIVGVPGADLLGGQSGRVDRFVLSGGVWVGAGSLFGSLVDLGDEFGRGLALDGQHAVIGSPHTLLAGPSVYGRVYTFGGLAGGGQ